MTDGYRAFRNPEGINGTTQGSESQVLTVGRDEEKLRGSIQRAGHAPGESLMAKTSTIYYTRCPVPTASGIAFQAGNFNDSFANSGYEVRNITELGPQAQNVHYTHSIEAFFREGGAAPPIWARANDIDSVVLAMTFVEELLGVYVRVDDPVEDISELAGRRIAVPVWPRLIFNFWRFVALHGLNNALASAGLTLDDVQLVDVEEGWDPSERRNVSADHIDTPARCEYRNQLHALLDGRVDAMWGKGLEAALLEGEAAGQIRLLLDLRDLRDSELLNRASIPRVLTTSRAFLNGHREAVVRYIRTLIDASQWADRHRAQAKALIARECGFNNGAIDRFVGPELNGKMMPRFSTSMNESLQQAIDLLHELGFTGGTFAVEDWVDPGPLYDALGQT